MKLKLRKCILVIRKSMVPEREPAWFHDYHAWQDGAWQLGFFIWLIHITRGNKP